MTKAIFFDVFGTLVDWRTSIARESERLLAPPGPARDAPLVCTRGAVGSDGPVPVAGCGDCLRAAELPALVREQCLGFASLGDVAQEGVELVGAVLGQPRRDGQLHWEFAPAAMERH